ncbi:hypothetical protein QOT17_020848 [Balamuthia mandrillaris]
MPSKVAVGDWSMSQMLTERKGKERGNRTNMLRVILNNNHFSSRNLQNALNTEFYHFSFKTGESVQECSECFQKLIDQMTCSTQLEDSFVILCNALLEELEIILEHEFMNDLDKDCQVLSNKKSDRSSSPFPFSLPLFPLLVLIKDQPASTISEVGRTYDKTLPYWMQSLATGASPALSFAKNPFQEFAVELFTLGLDNHKAPAFDGPFSAPVAAFIIFTAALKKQRVTTLLDNSAFFFFVDPSLMEQFQLKTTQQDVILEDDSSASVFVIASHIHVTCDTRKFFHNFLVLKLSSSTQVIFGHNILDRISIGLFGIPVWFPGLKPSALDDNNIGSSDEYIESPLPLELQKAIVNHIKDLLEEENNSRSFLFTSQGYYLPKNR